MKMSRRNVATLALMVACTAWLSAQAGQQFQFVVSATDEAGVPVTDLKPEEVLMTETAGKATVTRLEPFSLPMKITITVDNGQDSTDALSMYRSGLKGFVEAFPTDVEMAIITTAPQPRFVVRPTADRAQILRGVTGFAIEQQRPRFTDALVEFSQRLEKESRDNKIKPYVPVLLMVSTAANEQTDYQPGEVQKAINFLVARRARLYATVTSTKAGDVTADLNTNRQAIIAIPTTKATGGKYEAIAVFSRLNTLLPEWGKELAAWQVRLKTQFLVTVQRAAAGELQNPRVEIARPGLKGAVSLDGYLPQ